MNWLNRLERKFGKYAIKNLPLYIVILYAVGVVLNLSTGGSSTLLLNLNPYLIIHEGQFWRLFTFLMTPPTTNIIFVIFVLLFYYTIGQSLCHVWGAFRFNMYILTGVLGTIAGAFLTYAITGSPLIFMDSYYLNLSMFLAYAAIFPEMQVYLYGILPIKVKWLGYLDVVLLAVSFFQGDLGAKVSIIVSMLNFLLFFFSTRNYNRISPAQRKRKKEFEKSVVTVKPVTKHRCAICGRTDEDHPELEFRYCSKCNGMYEYCNDHLFTHVHVK